MTTAALMPSPPAPLPALSRWPSLPVLSEDGLGRYMRQVSALPMLSAEEERSLAQRYRQHGDLQAAGRLVISHLRLVVSIARGYAGYGLPQVDLIQEGNVGLMKAVKRFDPSREVRLVSFALHWIRAEIHEYVLRNWRLVRLATTKAQHKLFFNLRSLRQHLGTLSGQETERIAQELGVKPEEVREMEQRMNGQEIALENTAEQDTEDAYAPIQWLADSHYEPVEQLAQREHDWLHSEGIAGALATLDTRSRRVVEARWLQDDSGATLHQLAAEFGVSAERIRQIEVRALRKMRDALEPT